MTKPLILLTFLSSLFLTQSALAASGQKKFSLRADMGIFNGRIARTQNENTLPYNTPSGHYAGVEMLYGGDFSFLLGGKYSQFNGKTVTATSSEDSALIYRSILVGPVLSSKWTEWRLLYVQQQTPYTESPTVDTLVPKTVDMNYVRAEGILYSKADKYRLSFSYFFNHALAQPEVTGGVMKSNYWVGGCARVLVGTARKFGPAICMDLQELEMPQETTIFRQEVHARLTVEF